jgi:radical SAM-linked protein
LSKIIGLVVKFRVAGKLRFLSHAEMLSVFQRACVRADINVKYSEGFNPRPKMSLPLPRPVGVESDDELLYLRKVNSTGAQQDENTSEANDLCAFIKAELSAQLPEGCELLSVSVAEKGRSFQPCSATYVLPVRPEYIDEKLKATIARLLASENLNIQRRMGLKTSKVKNLDVRAFLKSIKPDDRGIIVECNISSAGAIRVDEILRLLELDENKLKSPVRRMNVQWQVNES